VRFWPLNLHACKHAFHNEDNECFYTDNVCGSGHKFYIGGGMEDIHL